MDDRCFIGEYFRQPQLFLFQSGDFYRLACSGISMGELYKILEDINDLADKIIDGNIVDQSVLGKMKIPGEFIDNFILNVKDGVPSEWALEIHWSILQESIKKQVSKRVLRKLNDIKDNEG